MYGLHFKEEKMSKTGHTYYLRQEEQETTASYSVFSTITHLQPFIPTPEVKVVQYADIGKDS